MEGFSPDTISSLNRSQKSDKIWKWLYFKKWAYRIKITQPNLMILVSFSSVEDALSNDVKKKKKLLAHKVLKILPFHFFGGHRV